MYSLKDLTIEIEQVIKDMENNIKLNPEWITQAVMNRHPDVDGKDSDFYRIVSRTGVREQVRKRLNRYKITPEAEPDRQILMEGFERLQKRYLIKEDDEHVAIRVQDMTRKQRLEKAAELRAIGDGCYQHADELERYNDYKESSR